MKSHQDACPQSPESWFEGKPSHNSESCSNPKCVLASDLATCGLLSLMWEVISLYPSKNNLPVPSQKTTSGHKWIKSIPFKMCKLGHILADLVKAEPRQIHTQVLPRAGYRNFGAGCKASHLKGRVLPWDVQPDFLKLKISSVS